ncbi:MAG TPA: hypothetical protein VHC67_01285 [Gaiellaceae bacterium]|jgi:hypothetical protein|nr:hypothetical protein [Gaiellaceae bacterium]
MRVAGVIVYLALGGAVVGYIFFGRHDPRAGSTTVSSPPAVAAALSFPAPPPGATVFAREAGADVVAAGVVQRAGRWDVQVSVVGAQGGGVPGLRVLIGSRTAAACGTGCYRAEVAPARPLPVTVSGHGLALSWSVDMPAKTVPAAGLLEAAGRAWRGLHSLAWREVLGSDATHVVRSRWRAEAPDRVAYSVSGGGAAVIVAGRRWDRRGPEGGWSETVQDPPIRQPRPFWAAVADAHVLEDRGDTEVVSFFDPRNSAWFRVELELRTKRTLRLDMYATAHFMHDAYVGFDGTTVTSPR